VVAQIIPWNVPLMMAALKLAPALAAGCTVVLKPAEAVCMSVLEFIADIADLIPPGVVNVVTSYIAVLGEPLVSHPKVRKVAVHRVAGDRAEDHGVRGGQHHPADLRAGRKVGQHCVCRRRRGRGRGVGGDDHHLQQGAAWSLSIFSELMPFANLRCISTAQLQLPRHVGEARQVQLVCDGHRLGRAVAVLGQNQVRFTAARVVALEGIWAVQQNDHVRILF
jgi:hypothetical protein